MAEVIKDGRVRTYDMGGEALDPRDGQGHRRRGRRDEAGRGRRAGERARGLRPRGRPARRPADGEAGRPHRAEDRLDRGAPRLRGSTSSSWAPSSTRRRSPRWRTPTGSSPTSRLPAASRRTSSSPASSSTRSGLERGMACGVDMFCMGVSASETHSRKNTGMGIEEANQRIVGIAKSALAAGKRVQVSVQSAFGCGYEGPVPKERVVAIVQDVPRRGPARPEPRRHRRPRDARRRRGPLRPGPRPRRGRRVDLPLPQHLRPRPRQLLRGAAGGRPVLRVVGGRPRRLPVHEGGRRQHLHRGPRPRAAAQRPPHRHPAERPRGRRPRRRPLLRPRHGRARSTRPAPSPSSPPRLRRR